MKQTNPCKSLLSLAVASALGLSPEFSGADQIVKIKIEDVGSTVAGVYSSALDGYSGGFRFSTINPETYQGASLWTGDAGTGEMLWEGVPNATGSFSTGFLFSGAPFVPFTFGNHAVGSITLDAVTGEPELTVETLDFGGVFGGSAEFRQPPDAGSLNTNWVVDNGDGTFKVSFQWAHDITSADDPSLIYTAFTGRWILEGTATVSADALPRIVVDLDIPEGAVQECSSSGGSFVLLLADITLINGAELAAVSWVIDGEPAGTGESIEPFLELGNHTVTLTAESSTGQTSVATGNVRISDTTAPDLNVGFIDATTGDPITSVARPDAQRVIARFEAVDTCDPQPATDGIGGFSVNNGDLLKIKARKRNGVIMTTDSLTLRASSTDESGNSVSGEQTLTITD